MTIALLVILGLCGGSFVNAWVWRLHETQTNRRLKPRSLSIFSGRSMCPQCRHTLAWYDLVPVLSWVVLGGRCRYCKQPISAQYPLVELLTAGLFVLSYVFWPMGLEALADKLSFGLWLVSTVVLVAMAVYDLRWLILPDVYNAFFALFGLVSLAVLAGNDTGLVADRLWGVVIAGGFFTLLLAVSKGRWIGGGDVKFAYGMGLWLGAVKSAVALLASFYIAVIIVLPLMLAGRVKRKQLVPFGPFLIAATVIAMLWGQELAAWYRGLVGV